MSIVLKSYQKDAIEAIVDGFKKNKRQYVEMPTGSGKTFTFLYYAKNYSKSILIIVPSIQLMNQVYDSAKYFYDKKDISRKGNKYDEEIGIVHICVCNSLRKDYGLFLSHQEFDLVIIDEAHHTQANTYKNFIKNRDKYFKEKDSRYLGVTATPDRVDGKLLDDILYECSFKLSIDEMITQGHLCDIEGYSIKTNIDISDIQTFNGDFNLQQLYKKLSCQERNNLIFNVFKEHLSDRKTIVFCVNIKHTKEINKMFLDHGIKSSYISSCMDKKKIKEILHDFKTGKICVLCNCQLLTEGFDEPSIDGILLARPTKSRALFLQMIGRGLRIYQGKKNCKIIDISDNHKNLASFGYAINDNENQAPVENFSSFKELKEKVNNYTISLQEYTLQRVNLLTEKRIDQYEATPCMIKYLNENYIFYVNPVSFDEGSFLVWFDKLVKEYESGIDQKRRK